MCIILWRKDVSTMYESVSPFCEMVFRPCMKRCVTLLWNGVSYFSQIFIDFKPQLALHAPASLTRNTPHFVHTMYVRVCLCVGVCVCVCVCVCV